MTEAYTPLAFTCEQVAVKEIAVEDERFRLTRGGPSAELRDLIARLGCLQPALVARRSDKWIPVGGFRRLQALSAETPDATVWVRRLPDDLSEVEVLQASAHEVRCSRSLTPFEVARGISLARSLGLSREAISAQLAGALGLGPHPMAIKQHEKLLSIPGSLAEFLEDKAANLRRATRFIRMTEEHAEVLVGLARTFGLSLRAMEEWKSMLGDIAKRDGKGWGEVAETLLSDPGVTSQMTYQSLWAQRYPRWAERGRDVQTLIDALDLSERFAVTFDPRFEDEGVVMTLRVTNVDELQADAGKLANKARLSQITRLLDLV